MSSPSTVSIGSPNSETNILAARTALGTLVGSSERSDHASLHRRNPAVAGLPSYSGGGIRTRDLRVMSPNQGSRWTRWDEVSSGFREIEIGWDRLESVGHVAPFVAPATSEHVAGSMGPQPAKRCGSSSGGGSPLSGLLPPAGGRAAPGARNVPMRPPAFRREGA
jgi:hypothetical protein